MESLICGGFLEEELATYLWKQHCGLHGHKVGTGHKMLEILGVKGSMSLIFPAIDGVASLWSAC